jgi:hypothetical protein
MIGNPYLDVRIYYRLAIAKLQAINTNGQYDERIAALQAALLQLA